MNHRRSSNDNHGEFRYVRGTMSSTSSVASSEEQDKSRDGSSPKPRIDERNPFSPPTAGIPKKSVSSQRLVLPTTVVSGRGGMGGTNNSSHSQHHHQYHPGKSFTARASLDQSTTFTSSSGPPPISVTHTMSTVSTASSAPMQNHQPSLVTSSSAIANDINAASASLMPSSSSMSLLSTTQSHNENTGIFNDNRTSKDYYFDSYSHHGIHEEMLKDEVRTRTYQMAILKNRHLFEGKIVLDVGCGTGILSMFAAQAGARHVYGVDSSGIIEQARLVVGKNGFQDTITLIHGKIEDIELPVQSVDIIISEWMGYALLYESMLETVLFARDKWLVKEPFSKGVIFPDKAVLYVGAIENTTDKIKNNRINFWENVYGFDMTPIKNIALQEPVIDVISGKSVISNCVPILTLDLLKCTKESLSFRSNFTLEATRNDYFGGLVSYFEVGFTQIHKPIGFSTAPFAKYTHWKQTLFFLEEEHCICEGEKIHGEIVFAPNRNNPRDLDISLSVSLSGKNASLNSLMYYRLR